MREKRGDERDRGAPAGLGAPQPARSPGDTTADAAAPVGARVAASAEGRADAGDEPWVVPIGSAFDLHSFAPRDVLAAVDAYLDAARELGLVEVRLVHGRGKGVQRAQVRRMLAADPRVERFGDAPADRGGWGATIAWLRPLAANADTGSGD